MLQRAFAYAMLGMTVALIPEVASAQAWRYTVGDTVRTITFASGYGGEVQSTVIPPGLKPGCPKGRVLVTNDFVRPPHSGTVIGRDLSALGGPDILSAFGPLPSPESDLAFATNDHDIAALGNGDVVLAWGVHIRAPLMPKPSWFDSTYHGGGPGSFGPGVRRGLMAWRSTDCGATFKVVSRIDPALVGDGSCAFPQPLKPPGSTYFNGGADGQLLRADVRHNRLFLTFSCVGFYPDNTKTPFTLSSKPVNKTLVFRSDDGAGSWQLVATVPANIWRLDVAPLNSGDIVFGESTAFLFAHPSGKTYTLDTVAIPAPPPAQWGWDSSPVPAENILAYRWSSTLVMRGSSSRHVIIGFPDIIDPGTAKAVKGYRVFFYDRKAKKYAEAKPIVPLVLASTSVVFHPVAIDPGRGPILLYWYDVDGAAKKATIRGRAILGDRRYSNDFSISRMPGPSTRFFPLTSTQYWFGDYLTAGGYAPPASNALRTSYYFYPMWVEPDGTARLNEVVVYKDTPFKVPYHEFCCAPLIDIQVLPAWRNAARFVNFAAIRPSVAELKARDAENALTATHR